MLEENVHTDQKRIMSYGHRMAVMVAHQLIIAVNTILCRYSRAFIRLCTYLFKYFQLRAMYKGVHNKTSVFSDNLICPYLEIA